MINDFLPRLLGNMRFNVTKRVLLEIILFHVLKAAMAIPAIQVIANRGYLHGELPFIQKAGK